MCKMRGLLGLPWLLTAPLFLKGLRPLSFEWSSAFVRFTHRWCPIMNIFGGSKVEEMLEGSQTHFLMGTLLNRTTVFLSQSDRALNWPEECGVDSEMTNEEPDQASLTSLMESVRVLLQGLGEDLSRDGLINTPLRVARALLLATRGYRFSAEHVIDGALFTEAGPENGNRWLSETGGGGGSGGMVVVRNIDLFATCESCLLPFRVCCHMAYIPSRQRVVGLSKLPRVAEVFAARLQNPERLANDIAKALSDGFHPLGVAVVAEYWHLQCSELRGYNAVQHSVDPVAWVRRLVYAGKGEFGDRTCDLWSEFLAILKLAGIAVQPPYAVQSNSMKGTTCPFSLYDDKPTNGKTLSAPNGLKPSEVKNLDAMVEAVRCLLQTLGEDPNREELKLTPLRYVRWLLTSTQGSRGLHDIELISNGKVTSVNGCYHQAIEEKADESEVKAVLDLPFCSQCEHHLLPFSGVAHVGYLQAGKSIHQLDRLTLQRLLKLYSCRLQVQERLTKQLAEAVGSFCGVTGVMVVLEASHICMISRGIKKVASTTATVATLGQFTCNVRARTDFLERISRL